MSLNFAAIPLAAGAGALGVLSPCVWPLVPVVMSSAASAGRGGAGWLIAGLTLSFALAGTLLSFLLVSLGLDPELFRYLAGAMLVLIAAILLIRPLGDWLSLRLSLLSGRLNAGTGGCGGRFGSFGVDFLLGLVWLPCVGPTLGAAIALASVGQSLGMAFLIMLAYAIGTSAVLLVAGLASHEALRRWRPQLMSGAGRAKQLLGATLGVLGVLVLTGWDKRLESLALDLLPTWLFTL